MRRFWEWDPVFEINKNKCALLVIDMQEGFLSEDASMHVPMAKKQISLTKEIIASLRSEGVPVIYSVYSFDENTGLSFYKKMAGQRGLCHSEVVEGFSYGGWATQISKEIEPCEKDTVIIKPGYDCFHDTELEEVLKKLDVDTLLVTGTVVNWCVDSTVRTAYHKNIQVVIVSDAVSAHDHAGLSGEKWCEIELDLFAEAFGQVVSSEKLIKILKESK